MTRQSEIARYCELGAREDLLPDETRTLTLTLPQVGWALLEIWARTEDRCIEYAAERALNSVALDRLLTANAVNEARQKPQAQESNSPIAREGRIYFIQKGKNGPIKIGVTTRSVESRIRELRTGADEKLFILLIIDQTEAISERALHERFAAHRKTGEWFEPCEELLELIDRLKAEGQAAGPRR